MRRPMMTVVVLVAILAGCGGENQSPSVESPTAAAAAPEGGEGGAVILATTTSTQESGLLDELVPAFEKAKGLKVKVIAVGSGQAIELGERGEADVLLVHSPAAEEDLMAKGTAGSRRVVMHNDFVLIGPTSDPARVRTAKNAAGALGKVSVSKAPFISRGDDSGTHKLELTLWEQAGVTPTGGWYSQSGQGMGQTIQIAGERQAYTVADRGTWLAAGTKGGLDVLFEGDPALLNVYHVIDMTTEAGQRVNAEGGRAFADWIVSAEAQRMIGSFGTEQYGRPLFVPDAGKSDDEVREAA